MSQIEVKNISKQFKETQALKDVSLEFKEHKIYGLLGRNGAGKSTLLNIITNRIFADGGAVFIDGKPAMENDEALQKVYMMSEKTYYPEGMKIKEVIQWSKVFYPDFDEERAKDLAQKFGLNLNKKVKSLSTGYHSIFKIVIALSVNTPYVLLDEPILGLDANHRDMFYRELLEGYSKNPCTFVISTHLIEEVSNVIEEIIIIKDGEIIRNQSCESLLRAGYSVSGKASDVDQYIAGKEVLSIDVLGGLKTAYILGTLSKETLPDTLEPSKLDLQKLFIQLTNS